MIQEKYQGIRPAPGYPACPDHSEKALLFNLLDAQNNIGVELTEGFMMDPEASVSAIVFHHPEAKYFNLSESDIEQLEKDVLAK